jgi:hypothetical protein
MKKILFFASIPLLLAIYFWTLTEAFHLLSAQSDLAVLFGVLLLCILLFTLIIIIRYAKKLF